MSLQTLSEGAPTLNGSGLVGEQESAAEQYVRLREALTSVTSAERSAAAAALVESGSSAVFPLLRVVEDEEDYEVAVAALWSLIRLTDDLLGGPSRERDTPGAVLERGRLTDKYLRLGLEAVKARSTGGSPANTALSWTYYVDGKSRTAAMRFFEDMIRQAPDLDPELPNAVRRISRRHPFPGVRRRGAELLAEYERREDPDSPTASARAAIRLTERRESIRALHDKSPATIERLLTAVSSDPDRQVRHIAAASLYRLLRNGERIRTAANVTFIDREVSFLFVNGEQELWVNGSAAKSLPPLRELDERTRRCVLRLLVHLRPVVNAVSGAELDENIREAMRDKEREVRRDATAVARVMPTDYLRAELVARLRERLRMDPPKRFPIVIWAWFVCAFLIPLLLIPYFRYTLPLSMMLNALFQFVLASKHRMGKHQITSDDYLETLQAMESVAETAPDKLRESLPELRKLAGPGAITPDVRTKARQLLAMVHQASLDELPIAATAPETEAAKLPLPAAAAEGR